MLSPSGSSARAYGTSTSSQRAAQSIWRNPAIPPIILLTVVTSFAFNLAIITRRRREEERLHKAQCAVLEDLASDIKTRLPTRGASVGSAMETEEEVSRRLLRVGLRPERIGLRSSAFDRAEEVRNGPQSISWSEVLFGKKGEAAAGLERAGRGIGASLREALGYGSSPAQEAGRAQGDDRQSAKSEQEEWSGDEWEKGEYERAP